MWQTTWHWPVSVCLQCSNAATTRTRRADQTELNWLSVEFIEIDKSLWKQYQERCVCNTSVTNFRRNLPWRVFHTVPISNVCAQIQQPKKIPKQLRRRYFIYPDAQTTFVKICLSYFGVPKWWTITRGNPICPPLGRSSALARWLWGQGTILPNTKYQESLKVVQI